MRSIARKDARTARIQFASPRLVFSMQIRVQGRVLSLKKGTNYSFSRTLKKTKNGVAVDGQTVTYGRFASSTAMTTKAVRINVHLITRSDKPIVPVK